MVAVTARLLGQSLTVTSAVVVSVATSMVAIFDAVDSATYTTVPSGAAVTDFAPNSPGIVRTSAPVVSSTCTALVSATKSSPPALASELGEVRPDTGATFTV